MGHSLVVHVLDSLDEHLDQAPANFRLESAFLGNIFEELSSLGEFQNDDGPDHFLFSGKGHLCVSFTSNDIDQMLEVESREKINLPLE